MANGVNILDAASSTVEVLTELVTDADLGITGQRQHIALQDGTVGSTHKLIVDASGRAKVDASGVPVPVTDNGGSLTVDGSVGVSGVVHVDDNAGSLSVDDGGGSLTVDGTVAVSGTVPVSAADGSSVAIGATTDLEASGNGTLIGLVKRLRTLLNGGLPAALGANGGLKIEEVSAIALDRSTDSAAVTLATDAIAVGSQAAGTLVKLTPKFAKISTSATGATTVVAAVASKKIRVLGWNVIVASAINVKWQSHVTPTDLSGLYCFGANGGIMAPFSPVGYFETVAGEALDINCSSAGIAVGGTLVYVEV